jgi:hypothetical protein
MRSGPRRCRLTVCAAVFGVVGLTGALASAHSFPAWSGTSGPFAWQAKRLSCGAVGGEPSRIRAHTRWSSSPANGYQRVTFTRQIRDDSRGNWVTVERQRRSTRNTKLEGIRSILHWSQFFAPFADEGGKTSRHLVFFEWLRDRAGPDRRVTSRSMNLKRCVVGA